MGFFTVGNLITLGIVVLVLFLYRQLDRNTRTLKLLRDYSEKLKKELNVFVKEQEKAVKDYSISLNVERDAAKELMKRLQLTEEELGKKAQSLAKIDNQIKAYENSLAELDRMTNRVQENMNRVRDESTFVDSTGRRLGEVKDRLGEFEKTLTSLGAKFEKENAETLGKTAEKVITDIKSTVTDIGASAEKIKNKVEEHRLALHKMEESRAAGMARDTEYINKILAKAVEQAGKRADKMEEAALASLKEQAEDRIRRLKTAEEEQLRNYQENAKARVAEVQALVKSLREQWRTERNEWELKDSALRDERRKNIEELAASFNASRNQIEEFSAKAGEIVSSQEAMLLKTTEEMKLKVFEQSEAKLEEYRRAQDMEFRRLETLADDSRKLDAELRLNMQEVIERMGRDFSRYEKESGDLQKIEADKFASAASQLRAELAEIENGITALKTSSYENVSGKLKAFEDEFLTDLSKRNGEIEKRLLEWQENLERRLSGMGEEAESVRRELEQGLLKTIQTNFSTQDARLNSELELLKSETRAFEETIRGQMNAADDSLSSFREQLDQSLEEVRKEAEISIKAEVGKHSLMAAETVRQYQRELDDAQEGLTAKIRELDSTVEDARRRLLDLAAETDNRIMSVRSAVEDAERHIRDAVDQTKLVDKAEELAHNMERRIDDLKGDVERLDQRRAEVAQLENEFVKIKRLEDDVGAKMIRILAEKSRIETMEANFNRLLQVSRAVEEKLSQVSSSNDVLQNVQLQIRKLDETMVKTDEKYLRIERKNQILDNTNDGIDRNFKVLQDSEKISSKIGGELMQYAEELESIKTSIEKLSAESEKAREAVDRIDVLDGALEEIEERIKSMQRARQWIADAETRLEDLNRQAQTQARAIDSLVKGKKSGPPLDLGEGAPSLRKKENIIALLLQGWTEEEIAKALKVSRGEVQLVRETMPKDV